METVLVVSHSKKRSRLARILRVVYRRTLRKAVLDRIVNGYAELTVGRL